MSAEGGSLIKSEKASTFPEFGKDVEILCLCFQ